MGDQFDVALQNNLSPIIYDRDYIPKFPRKNKSYILKEFSLVPYEGGVFKNPMSAQDAKDRQIQKEAGGVYCYVTDNRKITGLW